MLVTALVPALNEIRTVGRVLDDLALALRQSGVAHEIILIDDGSGDGTGQEAQRRGVRVIRHAAPQGYGAALLAGAQAARGDWLLFIDADGTYPADAIGPLLAAAQGADMVVGARTGAAVHLPLLNRLAKAPIRWLVGYLAGRPVPDFNSGLRLVRREDLEYMRPLLPPRFSLTTTLTVGLLCRGRRVVFLPINYGRRLVPSKFAPLQDTWRLLCGLLRVGLLFRPGRILIPLAGLFALGGVASWFWGPGGGGAPAAVCLFAASFWAVSALVLDLLLAPAWRRTMDRGESG